MAKEKKKLGEILIEEGLLNNDSLANALAEQRKWGGRLGSLLIRMGLVSEEELAEVLERQLNIRCVTLHNREIDRSALDTVPVDMAKQYTVFPVRLVGKTLTLAMVDPLDIPTIDDLQFRLNVRIVPALALESEITRSIAVHYEGAIMENFAPPVRARKQPEVEEPEIIHASVGMMGTPIDLEKGDTGSSERAGESAKGPKSPTHRDVLEALIRLLIDKGVIRRDELLERLRKG